MEENQQPLVTDDPSVYEVLEAILDQDLSEAATFDRITIQRATPTEYMVRIFPTKADDYVPAHVRLD